MIVLIGMIFLVMVLRMNELKILLVTYPTIKKSGEPIKNSLA